MRNQSEITHNGETVTEILRLHLMWLTGDLGGERANLNSANLNSANLNSADLNSANLNSADLNSANLYNAELYNADLYNAELRNADLRYANLSNADLRSADLRSADLRSADLNAATGNMMEIKSAQFDTWPITWTTAPNGTVTLTIGCQSHDLALWEKSDPRWIAAMDDHAAEWWAKYRDTVLALVKASPATPWAEKGADNA